MIAVLFMVSVVAGSGLLFSWNLLGQLASERISVATARVLSQSALGELVFVMVRLSEA